MATKDRNGDLHSEKNGQFVSNGEGESSDFDVEALEKQPRGHDATIIPGKGEISDRFEIGGIDTDKYIISKSIIDYCENLTEDKLSKNQGWLSAKSKEDEILKDIIKLQGFDKHPQVVSENTIKELVKDGNVGFARGMKIPNGAELYRAGDMYVGRGVSGNGVYAAAFSDDGRFTDITEAIQTANKYAGYSSGYQGSVIIGALANDAKGITKGELIEIRDSILPKLPIKAQQALYNVGRFAAVLGYDFIDCDNNAYIVILNRGKTIVAK